MIKNIAIVSLSAGTIGEDFVRHEVEIGIQRLKNFGLTVRFMPHTLKGIEYVKNHPDERAADLIQAFQDKEIDMILCAIGGDDTYRLLPYLFEHSELANGVSDKVFLGFSDTTINHFMLHKVGIRTFYGQSFLADLCELGKDMLPYTIELLQGNPVFTGEILGGCIDSMYDMFNPGRYADMPLLCQKYELFPKPEEWAGKILLLESSEEKMSPSKYRKAIEALKEAGIFHVISGILMGKPMDETYTQEYKQILTDVINNPRLPILCNVNIGHAQPRCIIPFGVPATVDANSQVIRFGA